MLKKILYTLLALLAVYIILCFVGPKNMDVTTTKTINGSPNQVYGQIIEFRNWPNWSKWMKDDTAMSLTFGNPSSGLGGSYSWKSEKSGSGNMKITEVIPGQLVKSDLVFDDWNSTNKVTMELKPNGTNTDVTWKMIDEKPFPFFLRGMMLVMNMNGSIQKDFDAGLANMDSYIKSGKAATYLNGFSILESDFPATTYLGKRSLLEMKDLSAYFAKHFPEIAKLAGNKCVGPPVGIYWKWDMNSQKGDMAAAMPVSMSEILNDQYKLIPVPTSRQYIIEYHGGYDKMALAYQSLDSMIHSKGIPNPSLVIEEYITDPMTEKDTSKWLTVIHFLTK